MQTTLQTPSFREFFCTWLHIGLVSFGGPAAQIALMHRLIVDEKRWLSETQFLNALNFCMLLPGPEAMQLATYCGWRQRGMIGGVISGGLFVLPGAIIIALLAACYVHYADVSLVQSAFVGIKAAVIMIILQALLRISQRVLLSLHHQFIALAAFLALFLLQLPYPLVIFGAASAGYFLFRKPNKSPLTTNLTTATTTPAHSKPCHQTTIRTLVIGISLWASPLLATYALFGKNMLFDMGVFFSKLAVISFGGAYAVLAYMTQTLVQENGWISTPQMIDALGLAESTPGPLILVTEFTAYIAAYYEYGTWYAIAATLMTLWVTFVPCYLWIFIGAPYLQWLSQMPTLKNILSGITAGIVGVMLNLGIWFALTVYFQEIKQTTSFLGVQLPTALPTVSLSAFDMTPFAISLLAAALLFKYKTNLLLTLALCALTAAGLGMILSA